MWWNKQKSRAVQRAATGSPLIMSLEPRMLFDGAVAATVATAADNHSTVDAAKPPSADQAPTANDTHDQADTTPAAAPVAVPGTAVVFIDSRVKDFDSLLKGVAPGTQVVVLDGSKDGLQQIADYLGSHQGVSTVEIIAHGNAGDLWLGSTYLSADNVASRAEVLADIGKDMNVGGDILIYACYTAEGERGVSFVDALAQYTGRDIAASTNRTGLGGDWTLEIATGAIESTNLLSQQVMNDYQWGLATWTATNGNDSGAGSLRDELVRAQSGDIVTFTNPTTVLLNAELVISKNVTIEGDLDKDGIADVTLDGQYKTNVLTVNSGVTATLDGLIITRGLIAADGADNNDAGNNAMGAGISNYGNLTLHNVSVTRNAASGGGGGSGVAFSVAGGGGGGAVGGGMGGSGGNVVNASVGGGYTGSAGSANQGGNGGSFDGVSLAGGGGSSVGGLGGAYGGYSQGGAGATASSGGLSIGGGGGAAGYDQTGGKGGNAVGGIFNASGATLAITGNSAITGNIGAGGGGGGGAMTASGFIAAGADGGKGVGAIWNEGTLLITAANLAALTGTNAGASGAGGTSTTAASGATLQSENAIFNNGGQLDDNYIPPLTSTIVVGTPTLNIGSTTVVTITFSSAVTGFTLSDLSAPNGTLSNLVSSDNGVTWTATFTPSDNIAGASGQITLDNSNVNSAADNSVGVGTATSNSYSVDTVRPTATVVVTESALKIGDTSLVTITFSEAVVGFNNADLTVANGTLTAMTSGDGGVTWAGTFTPSSGITDTSNVISLDNTAYTDTGGNVGVGTTDSNNYAIDTLRPTATIVFADPMLTAGESSLVTITFSEAITGLTNADLAVPNGTLGAVQSADGGITWTATYTPDVNVNSATNVISLVNTGIADLAGNTGAGAANSVNFSINTVLPSASIVMANPSLNIGGTSLVTITFNAAVTGFTNSDLTVQNGSLSAVSSSDGGVTWTATFTPTGNVTDSTNLIVLDNSGVQSAASGNVGSGTTDSNNYAIDTQRPTATIDVATDHLGIGGSSVVTITFNEAVTGFDLTDLTTDNGTLSNLSTVDNIVWTATLTPSAGITQNNNQIVLDNSTVTDIAGNGGSGTTRSNAYDIDSVRPTATIVIADPTLTAGETSLVTITFSEAVTGFDNSDLNVPNGILSVISSSDGGITWTATFTPTDGIKDTTNLISLNNPAYTDLAGNAGVGTTNSANFTIDTVRPIVTIIVADPSLKAGETSLVTLTFSEAVSGVDLSDLSVANGTLSNLTSADGGITWTAVLVPDSNITDTSNLITLNNGGVANASGNTGIGTTDSNNYAIDTQRPTASITVANPNLGIGQTTTVTIVFSEPVSGLDLSDLSVANGTLSSLNSADGGITWTATLTPTAGISDATNLVVLDTSGVQDLAGNAGVSIAISNNYGVDGDLPTATIVVANPNLTAGQTTTVTIAFSEQVTGFDLSDLSVANGTLSNLASSDGGKTWTATLTPTANLNTPGNLITLDTSQVADLAGNAGSGMASSNAYVVATVPTVPSVVVVGDPTFGAAPPSVPHDLPTVPLQPSVFVPPTGGLGSPLTFAPLFEQRVLGDGIRPLGDIFIRNGATSPSFIAQVFSSTDGTGDGSGSGFLGFGGGDGGVFGTSTLSSLFKQDADGLEHGFKAFDSKSIKGNGDPGQGLQGTFGAPTLGQQLQQINDMQQRQVIDLAQALQQVGISEMQA